MSIYQRKYYVGRTDGKPLSKKMSRIGRQCKVRGFFGIQAAYEYIEYLKDLAPDDVEQGKFFLDAPAFGNKRKRGEIGR